VKSVEPQLKIQNCGGPSGGLLYVADENGDFLGTKRHKMGKNEHKKGFFEATDFTSVR